jgi:hypothetical protein
MERNASFADRAEIDVWIVDGFLSRFPRANDHYRCIAVAVIDDVMSIRLTSRKTNDVTGLQLVPAIIIEEAWGAAQDINELVFGFVPMAIG